jgi:hypothetical protein
MAMTMVTIKAVAKPKVKFVITYTTPTIAGTRKTRPKMASVFPHLQPLFPHALTEQEPVVGRGRC